MELNEEELQTLYTWVDEIPLSRPKRNIARDFADGVLLAEVVSHFFPKLVELHNYSAANALSQKLYNWSTLNSKVLKRLGLCLSKQEMQDIANGAPGAIERALLAAKARIEECSSSDAAAAAAAGTYKTTPRGTIIAPGSLTPAAALVRTTSGKVSPARLQAAGLGGEVIADKERTISELRETNEILEAKVRKLEQLVKLKDAKIQTLMARLQSAGLA